MGRLALESEQERLGYGAHQVAEQEMGSKRVRPSGKVDVLSNASSPALSSRRIKAARSAAVSCAESDDDACMRYSPRQLQKSSRLHVINISPRWRKNQNPFIASGRIEYFGQAKHLVTKML